MKLLTALLLTTSVLLPLAAHAQVPPLAADAGADANAGADSGADSGGGADRAVIVVTGQADGYRADTASGVKVPTVLLDVPQTITVITREQLNDQGITQLGDALRYVPGVVIGQGEGHRDQISLRGQNTTADFYLDGLRDDTQYYRSLYNIERIEVLKGANALLFGRGGGGGVINRVSKTADLSGRRVTLDGGANSFGAFMLSADLNQPLSQNVGARLNGTYEEFGNHRDVYEGRFIGVNPTLAFAPGSDTRVTLSYTYGDDRRVVDRGVPSLGGVPLEGFRDTFFGREDVNQSTAKTHFVQAGLTQRLTDTLSLNAAVQFNHIDKYYGNVFVSGAVNPATRTVPLQAYNSFTVRGSWVGQANLVWQGQTGGINHTLLAGIEAIDQQTAASRNEAVFAATATDPASLTKSVTLAETIAVPRVTFGSPSRSTDAGATVFSAYVQDQIEIAPFLQIIGGVRYDAFRIAADNLLNNTTASRTDHKWSPRAGIVLKPRQSMSVYGSYTRSFLPQSGDQFSALDATQATLAPESFTNLEVGAKWDVTPALAFTAAAYRLTRENTRLNNPVTGLPELTGESRARGIELQLAGRILPAWQVSLGAALQEGEILSATTSAPAGRKLAQLPHAQIALWSRYDVTDKLGLALGVTHQSSSFATISNGVTLPAYTRVDSGLFYTLTPALSVQLNLNNVLNTGYFPSAHTDNNISTGEPRNVRLAVRAKF